jgi:cyanophycinase
MKYAKYRAMLLVILALLIAIPSYAATYQYFRIGNKEDVQTKARPGIAMMGGGKDLDEAFRWLCGNANGGDFLILRAHGDDDYNSYVNGLCKANSVATLIIPDQMAAADSAVTNIIAHAEAIFIAGGDQARYVNFWQGTAVEDAINAAIARGIPIGGTSAGLAIQGQFSYGALGDKPDDKDLASADVLRNPYQERVTLVRGFLVVPHLENTITDSHFAKRDRMGRTLVFLARILQDGWAKEVREVAIDERSAVLVDADGKGLIIGSGRGAYFLRPAAAPKMCRRNTPLDFANISVYHGPAGGHFDLVSWKGDGGEGYLLSVQNGKIQSTKADHSIY